MKAVKIIVLFLLVGLGSQAQFPTTDSLRRYIDKYIRESAISSFQNLRLNTALKGLASQIDTAKKYGGSGTGADTSILNDLYMGIGDTVLWKKQGIYGNGTFADPLDIRTVVIGNASELRALQPHATTLYRVVDYGNFPFNHVRAADFIYDPNDHEGIDDSVMIIRNGDARYHRVVGDFIDVKWFGARGDGVTDDWHSIQRAIDWIIFHPYTGKTRTLYFPYGAYVLSSPLMIHNFGLFGQEQYNPVNIRLLGAIPQKSGTETVVFLGTPAMNDKFWLGIQTASGVEIENIAFEGNYTKTYETPFLSFNTFVWKNYADYGQAGIRDSQYSPNCAINIDPFRGTLPPDGGYPGMSGWYRGPSFAGGSNAVRIINCRFNNFPVGIANSVNGETSNADVIEIEDCSFGNMKVALAVGQSQSKACTFDRNQILHAVHTVIDCGNYGLKDGNPPRVHGMNLAAGVKQLIHATSPIFPFNCNDVVSETIFRIGILGFTGGPTPNQHTFNNNQFNLYPSYDVIPSSDFILIGGNASFTGGSTIALGPSPTEDTFRLKLLGANLKFNGGSVSPMIASYPDPKFNARWTKPAFSNMSLYIGQPGKSGGKWNFNRGGVENINPDQLIDAIVPSDFTLKWTEVQPDLLKYEMRFDESAPDKNVLLGTGTLYVTDSAGQGYIKVPSASWLKKIKRGDYILSDSSAGINHSDMPAVYDNPLYILYKRDYAPVLGVVHLISNDTLYMRGIGINVPVDTVVGVKMYVNYIRKFIPPFTANTTTGSATLSSVEEYLPDDGGSYQYYPAIGDRIEGANIPEGAYVIASSLGAHTITLSDTATGTVTRDQFINGNPKITAYATLDPITAKAAWTPPYFAKSIWKWSYATSGVPAFEDYWVEQGMFQNHASRTVKAYSIKQMVLDSAASLRASIGGGGGGPYVTTNTVQDITGAKRTVNANPEIYADGTNTASLTIRATGTGNSGFSLYRNGSFALGTTVTTNNDIGFLNGTISRNFMFIKSATNNVLMDPPFDNDNGSKLQVTGAITSTLKSKYTAHPPFGAPDSLAWIDKKYVDSIVATVGAGSGTISGARNTGITGEGAFSHISGSNTLNFKGFSAETTNGVGVVTSTDSTIYISFPTVVETYPAWSATYPTLTDGQSWYFGPAQTSAVPTITVNTRFGKVFQDCELFGYMLTTAAQVAGTGETFAIYIRKNNASDILLSNAVTISTSNNTSQAFSGVITDVSFAAGDTWEVKVVNPAWATNPQGVQINVYLKFRSRTF